MSRPEADHSLLAFATVAARANDTATGLAALSLRRALLGEDHDARIGLVDAYLALGELATARRFVDLALASDPLQRAQGRHRAGWIAVLEGRFAVAHDTLVRAAAENLPLGGLSVYTQVLSELRALADIEGKPGEDRRHVLALREFHYLGPGIDAALTYELAVLDRRPNAACPDSGPILATAPEGVERASAQRRIVRFAASRGCATCREVVEAGISDAEWSPRSLEQFGVCAEHEHRLDLARDAFARAAAITAESPEASVLDSMRATAHLGAVLVQLGDRDKARRSVQLVVTRWARAERHIPELELARNVLAALDAK